MAECILTTYHTRSSDSHRANDCRNNFVNITLDIYNISGILSAFGGMKGEAHCAALLIRGGFSSPTLLTCVCLYGPDVLATERLPVLTLRQLELSNRGVYTVVCTPG